jgi:FAD/FMN-containing dehydrogenase
MSIRPDFINDLRKHFTGDIRLEVASRILYSTDASIYQVEPLGVVFPKTQDDLHAVVESAAKYAVLILPRGAGTSLAGQAIGNAPIIDCSRWLDSVIEKSLVIAQAMMFHHAISRAKTRCIYHRQKTTWLLRAWTWHPALRT